MKITFEGTIEELEKFLEKIKDQEESTGRYPYDENLPCGVWFNKKSYAWSSNAKLNLRFLSDQQEYYNILLKCKGHLFLNDVYDGLGIPRTSIGQTVGWIYDEESAISNNHVDFGLDSEINEDFLNGATTDAFLEFNVDGVIIGRI